MPKRKGQGIRSPSALNFGEHMQDNTRPESVQDYSLDDLLNDHLPSAQVVPLHGPLDRPITLARFPDQGAHSKGEHRLSLRKLAERIAAKTAPAKDRLPWLKLARFGDVKTPQGCLRHNANVLAVSGVEADYDAGQLSLDDAARLLEAAGIAALLYTSASHSPEAPRWRVLAPLSREREPGVREALCARLNGALGGVLDGASFTLSQAFYYGAVKGRHPVETLLVDGNYLDLVEGVAPLGKDGRPWQARPAADPHSLDSLLADPPPPVDWHAVNAALQAIPPDCSYDDWLKVGMALHHATDGRDEGFTVWADWSQSVENAASDRELTAKWRSFGTREGGGVTLGSLFHLAGQRHQGVAVEADDFDDLDDDTPSAKPQPRRQKIRLLDPADPMPSARHLVRDRYTSPENLRTLHHYRGSFWEWNGACYRDLDEAATQAAIWTYLEPMRKLSLKGKETSFKPCASSVANVLAATKAVTHLPTDMQSPSWLSGAMGPNPMELVPVANGLLHLPSGRLLPPTPAFFTLAASDVAFDPDAAEPSEWFRFLDQVWPGDHESIDTLQEIFGYLLSADTSQQKIPLIVGPKRSGKGTIARVLTALVGQGNVVSPTLNSLATNFGAEPLIGKSVAIIGDARLSGKVDRDAITERLLGISGEDSQSIDRKYRGAWHGRLGVRFLVMSNELPALKDASGALAGRFLLLTMNQSFYGREDRGLAARLLSELPGVLNWAREGYLRLNRRGHFVPPASARESVEALEALGSPISAFIKDRCQVAPGLTVSCDDLHSAWREWCVTNRRDYPGTIASFGKELHAAVPGLTVSRPRSNGQQMRHYNGIDLNASERFSSDPFDE